MMRWLLRLSVGVLLAALLIWLWNRVNQDLEEEEDLDEEIPFEFDVPLDVEGGSSALAGTTANGDAGVSAGAVSADSMTTMPAEASTDVSAAGGDDLTVIKGIGPAYSAHLAEMGITTYGALIATPVDALATAFPRVSDTEVESWIAQARELAGPQG